MTDTNGTTATATPRPPDRRTRRTCLALRKALAEEIHATGDLSQVTVTAVTERADVTRRTFYTHYADIPALVLAIEDELMADIAPLVADISKATLDDLEGAIRDFEPCPGTVDLLAFFRKEGDILSALLGRGGDPAFRERIQETTCDVVRNRALDGFSPNATPAFEYYLAFVVSAEVGVLVRWLTTGMQEGDETMARIMTGLAFVRPGDLYGRPFDIDMAFLLANASTWSKETSNG